jgi:hypothetical protein
MGRYILLQPVSLNLYILFYLLLFNIFYCINIFYCYIKVLDPRLKLQYYADNKWENHYIIAAKRTITDIWTRYYKNIDPIIEESDEPDDLLDHVFKKKRTESNDELKIYLGEEVANSKCDILLWWKV